MEEKNAILRLVPAPPDWRVPWESVEQSALRPVLEALARTPQNPEHHGEGDAWTHTRLVCEALAGMDRFRQLEERRRQALFLAALLHDAGKGPCTRMLDGVWTSPRHAAVGAGMVREALWLTCGWCGLREWQTLRETVCALVRWHALPVHAAFEADGPVRLLRAAAAGELLPEFTVELLCLLAEADALGKRCGDQAELVEAVGLCGVLAEELGCLTGPRVFPSGCTAFACLSGGARELDCPRYDDTWGEVILLAGLPGTGKDTWIAAHRPDLPAVSLDEIRRERNIPPVGPQGRVIEEAQERAKALLRRRQPFIWNATNITAGTRQKLISLFTAYHASVRIVYLETEWPEQLRRNRSRAAVVPESAICRMLGKLMPPERHEAHRVEWRCV